MPRQEITTEMVENTKTAKEKFQKLWKEDPGHFRRRDDEPQLGAVRPVLDNTIKDAASQRDTPSQKEPHDHTKPTTSEGQRKRTLKEATESHNAKSGAAAQVSDDNKIECENEDPDSTSKCKGKGRYMTLSELLGDERYLTNDELQAGLREMKEDYIRSLPEKEKRAAASRRVPQRPGQDTLADYKAGDDAPSQGSDDNARDVHTNTELQTKYEMANKTNLPPNAGAGNGKYASNTAPKPPTQDDNTETQRPVPQLPEHFPAFHCTHRMNDIGAYLANTSYVVSICGPPTAELKYGVIVYPAGEERMLFGQGPYFSMDQEFYDRIADANSAYSEALRMHDPDRNSEEFQRHRFDDQFTELSFEDFHNVEQLQPSGYRGTRPLPVSPQEPDERDEQDEPETSKQTQRATKSTKQTKGQKTKKNPEKPEVRATRRSSRITQNDRPNQPNQPQQSSPDTGKKPWGKRATKGAGAGPAAAAKRRRKT
jgi:hypothetical protein